MSTSDIAAVRREALKAADWYVSAEAKAEAQAQTRTVAAATATVAAIDSGWIARIDKADKAKVDEILTSHGWDGEGQPSAAVRKAARDDVRAACARMDVIDFTTWGLLNGVSKTMVSQWVTTGRALALGITPDSDDTAGTFTQLTSGALAQKPTVKAAIVAEDATPAKVAAAIEDAKRKDEADRALAKAKRDQQKAKPGLATLDGDTPAARLNSVLALMRDALREVEDAKVLDGLSRRVAAMVAEVKAERLAEAG